MADHCVLYLAARNGVRGVNDLAEGFSVGFTFVCIELSTQDRTVTITVEELIEEELSKVVVSQINSHKNAAESLSCVAL